MKLNQIITSEIGTNTYILSADGQAMVIDPGIWLSKTQNMLDELGVVCTKVVLTHGHFDHATATAALEKGGAKVYVYYEEEALNNATDSLAKAFDVPYVPYRAETLLHDGDNISFCGVQFRVIHTPGHTAGSICLLGGGALFSGDTLFFEDVGRSDFPTGNTDDLRCSVKKLLAIDGDLTVYPGHGSSTTLQHEREFNPFA